MNPSCTATVKKKARLMLVGHRQIGNYRSQKFGNETITRSGLGRLVDLGWLRTLRHTASGFVCVTVEELEEAFDMREEGRELNALYGRRHRGRRSDLDAAVLYAKAHPTSRVARRMREREQIQRQPELFCEDLRVEV